MKEKIARQKREAELAAASGATPVTAATHSDVQLSNGSESNSGKETLKDKIARQKREADPWQRLLQHPLLLRHRPQWPRLMQTRQHAHDLTAALAKRRSKRKSLEQNERLSSLLIPLLRLMLLLPPLLLQIQMLSVLAPTTVLGGKR